MDAATHATRDPLGIIVDTHSDLSRVIADLRSGADAQVCADRLDGLLAATPTFCAILGAELRGILERTESSALTA